jgi:hypothetical protein
MTYTSVILYTRVLDIFIHLWFICGLYRLCSRVDKDMTTMSVIYPNLSQYKFSNQIAYKSNQINLMYR